MVIDYNGDAGKEEWHCVGGIVAEVGRIMMCRRGEKKKRRKTATSGKKNDAEERENE